MIRFTCSNCSRLISVDEKHSGKKGKCPKCGGVVVVPENSTIIEFACGSCGHKIRVPERHGGKKGACPKCKNPIVVPSPEKAPAEDARTVSITCSMCGQISEVPEGSSEKLTECPECGSYLESSSESVPAASAEFDTSIPPTTDEDVDQESPGEYEESAGVDRRLIVIISAVAAVVIVGLVILVAVLRSSRPKQEVADTRESSLQLQLDQVQEFAERHIGLLEEGEIDQARQSLTPGLANDAYRPQVERLAQQIGRSRIIEMKFTLARHERRPEGERMLLWYNLRYQRDTQTVIVSVLPTEQELTIDGIAARDRLGRTVSIGARSFTDFSRMGATVALERRRPPLGKLFSALFAGFAVGTLLSACCLWAGMKVTGVDSTFVAMLGIAAISSLAGMIPVLLVPAVPMICFGRLIGPIVMFVLICKWTDADFFPDAVGMVLVAGLVGIFARMFLAHFMAMA